MLSIPSKILYSQIFFSHLSFVIFIDMTLEQAKQILRDHGKPSCTCKYGGSAEVMIEEAKKLVGQSN
jgi:hypothetical protein